MKKLRLILLLVIAFFPVALTCEKCEQKQLDEEQGLISGWTFSPLQLGLGIDGYRNLMDQDTHTLSAFALGGLKQKSSALSFSTASNLDSNFGFQYSSLLANTKNNYALGYSPVAAVSENNYGFLLAGSADARNNYGLTSSLLLSYAWKNYGLTTGLLAGSGYDDNHGVKIGLITFEQLFELRQFCGIDFGGFLHTGVINYKAPVQFGLLNFSGENGHFQAGLLNKGDSTFQLGLLNYNPQSYIPYLPLMNWDMGRKVD